MAFKMNARSPLMKTLVGAQKNLPEGLKDAIEAAPGKMMDSPAKNMNKGYGTPAPAKMNKGERYDMKMASDQNLKASARKNYAENAEAAQKSSPAKKDIGPEKAAKVKVTGSNVPGASGKVKKYTKTVTKIPLKTSNFESIPPVKAKAKVKVTGSNVPGAGGQVKKYTKTRIPLKTSTFKDIPLVASPAKKKKPAADPAKTDAKIIKTNARLKDNLRRSKGPKSDMGPVGKEERRRVMKPVLKGTSIEKSVSLPPVKIK